MGVSKEKVNQIINDALANGEKGADCCETVNNAFRYLQRLRQEPGKSLDLAAAEHYMFARSQVCIGFVSAAQMRVLVISYDLKKLLDQRVLMNPNDQKVTANPVSPPEVEVVFWGLWGAQVGQGQHDRCNKDVKPPLWGPIEKVLGKDVGSVY